MALLARIYFNALFGALGGLLGWMLFGIFGDKSSSTVAQQLLGGAFIGGFIGYFVVSVDAIRDQSFRRFCRMASYGVVLGATGGALGMWIGEVVHDRLSEWLISWQTGVQATLRQVFEVVSRGLGWMLLGVAVGFSEGAAARSLGKLSYGMIGGALGGFVGGALFAIIKLLEKGSEGTSHLWGGAIGLVILGACIGALSALVQAVFQPASVKVMRGWQEGREYALLKAENLLGRDEAADIALFRDQSVEKRHAVIERSGRNFVLRKRESLPEQTCVNDEPVDQGCTLRDGDRIQLGGIILRFQMRAAKNREKAKA
jgi:Inner membrane component of T3SS, cytoplasmic domain